MIMYKHFFKRVFDFIISLIVLLLIGWFLILIAPSITGILNNNLTPLATLAALFGRFACFYNISKKLQKDSSIAFIATVFPIIMIPIIGLSKNYQFDNSIPVNENGPFQSNPTQNTKTDNQTNTTSKDTKYCPNCGKKNLINYFHKE